MLPRRPILIMPPSSVAEVGSPTRQASSASPRDLSQSSTFLVPLTATPSSSPVINRLIEPAKSRPRVAMHRSAGAMNAAMAPLLGGAGRHDIGMAGEAQIGPPVAPACVEVRDGLVTFFGEGQRLAGEAEPFEPPGNDPERTLVLGRDAR